MTDTYSHIENFTKLCKYKYNGKEFQDELELNMYAMDMRMYDLAIARWVVQDPIIHHNQSPYSSFDGNPVFWADPSGADSENKLWEEIKNSRSTEKIIQEKVAENSNTFNTIYINRDTGESVKIDDGVDEIIIVNSFMFAKAKNYANYFNKYFVNDKNSVVLNYIDFYYEARYGKAYLFDIDYWLDSGPRFPPSVIGGAGGLEYIGGGGFLKIGKFLVGANEFHRLIKPKILKSVVGEFKHIVGKNPDIGVEGGKIILQGAKNGPYKGKKYVTDLNALDYLQ